MNNNEKAGNGSQPLVIATPTKVGHFARKGETNVTVGRDLRRHKSQLVGAPSRLSPVGATDNRQAVSTPASIGYAEPRQASPVGATDNRQAVSTPAGIGYASIGYAKPGRPAP